MRFLIVPVLLLPLLAASATAQSLSEADAVRRGFQREEVRALLNGRLAENAGNYASAGLWANPEIEYSRETLDNSRGDSEDQFFWVRQRINIAGVKGLQRESAASGRIADDAAVAMLEREITADIRRLFYSAMAAEREFEFRSSRHARLQALAAAIRDRRHAGDASLYDQLRIERELALLEGERYAAKARAEAMQERLFARIGGGDAPLAGSLLPPAAGQVPAATVIDNHPRLTALAAEAESAALAAEAAGRERWPELTVGVGQREFRQSGANGDGGLFLLGIEVPIFDRGDGRRAAASGREHARRAEYAIAAADLEARLRALRVELNGRRQAALLLDPRAEAASSLSDIAESAYNSGEIGVMELIDAHRADLQLLSAYVTRAAEAREIFIQLQLLGEPE